MKQGFIFVLITALLFATLEPVSKLIAGEILPLVMTFLRFLAGGLLLLPVSISKIRKTQLKLSVRDYFCMVGLGVLNICISMVLLQYAVLKAESPALIAIIFSCNSVLTIVLAAIVLKDPITVKKIAALILCIIGILICSYKSLQTATGLLSVVYAVLSAVSFSVYTVFSKKLMVRISGPVQTGISFLMGSAVLFVVLLILRVNPFEGINTGNIWHMLYLGIGVTGLGYWAYFKALEKASATAASIAFFIKPILTPFISFLIVGTPFHTEVFVALVFVLAGSYLASYADALQTRTHRNEAGNE